VGGSQSLHWRKPVARAEGAKEEEIIWEVSLYLTICRREAMGKEKFVYYKEDDMYVGYLEEFPGYMTQGETLEELKLNLRDIYKELTSGRIPCVHHVAELEMA
jgi:hypothetical protein